MTVWIAGAVPLLALAASALWFDRLFEASGAVKARSLLQYLGSRSVLAVFAHPDDETLVAGALEDAGRSQGTEVWTVTLTRGKLGYPPPHLSRYEDLPLIRESELRRFGYVLGIDQQELWDYPDGGLDTHPSRDIVDRIAKRIRELKPDLVLTFDPVGGYNGHTDHRATGALTTEAVEAASNPQYKSELGALHRIRHLAYVVAPKRALKTLGGPELKEVAAAQPDPDVAIPVRRALRALGWRIHESQHLDRAYPLPRVTALHLLGQGALRGPRCTMSRSARI